MKKDLLEIIEKFKNKKIGVIGDLMLDHFLWGEVERISPEAPIPVVLTKKESFMPGGAGNTANNIVSLGGKVFLVGVIGRDEFGQRLIEELKNKEIDLRGIIESSTRPTTHKMRIIARNQQVVRVDRENTEPIDKETEEKAIDLISSKIKECQVVIISDYQKGFVTENIARTTIDLAQRNQKPVIGDTKSKFVSHFRGATLLVPNKQEAERMTGLEEVREIGKAIQKEINSDVLITQGAEGMTLFEKEKIIHLPAKAEKAYDITGAGDTVVAGLALAISGGASLEQAAEIANQAAAIVVGKIGTATASFEELRKSLIGNKS